MSCHNLYCISNTKNMGCGNLVLCYYNIKVGCHNPFLKLDALWVVITHYVFPVWLCGDLSRKRTKDRHVIRWNLAHSHRNHIWNSSVSPEEAGHLPPCTGRLQYLLLEPADPWDVPWSAVDLWTNTELVIHVTPCDVWCGQ